MSSGTPTHRPCAMDKPQRAQCTWSTTLASTKLPAPKSLFPIQQPAAFSHSHLSLHPSCSLFFFLQRLPVFYYFIGIVPVFPYANTNKCESILLFPYTQADTNAALTLLFSCNDLSQGSFISQSSSASP
uniref:Uncharacterized protein n=1 Tax=Rousettus aegyptiacus TaxID=9407 RepID=A0A7J8CIF4_ROUAE|nr:hypothetical protein HJG63_009080 [Rousettus aegyptiacus]